MLVKPDPQRPLVVRPNSAPVAQALERFLELAVGPAPQVARGQRVEGRRVRGYAAARPDLRLARVELFPEKLERLQRRLGEGGQLAQPQDAEEVQQEQVEQRERERGGRAEHQAQQREGGGERERRERVHHREVLHKRGEEGRLPPVQHRGDARAPYRDLIVRESH